MMGDCAESGQLQCEFVTRYESRGGLWGQKSGLRGGGTAPWVVLGRPSRCKTLLTICTCWPGCRAL